MTLTVFICWVGVHQNGHLQNGLQAGQMFGVLGWCCGRCTGEIWHCWQQKWSNVTPRLKQPLVEPQAWYRSSEISFLCLPLKRQKTKQQCVFFPLYIKIFYPQSVFACGSGDTWINTLRQNCLLSYYTS